MSTDHLPILVSKDGDFPANISAEYRFFSAIDIFLGLHTGHLLLLIPLLFATRASHSCPFSQIQEAL